MRPKLPFLDRVKFFLERQFVRGAFQQLIIVGAFIGLISLTGGVLLRLTEREGFGEAVWWAFLRLTDPGYLGDDEGTWRRVVSTWLTVSGYVVFLGALVAIMTRWLIAAMTRLERGLTPVSLRGHIVVLGWNSRSAPLIRELASARTRLRRFLRRHHVRRLRLVILAEEVSAGLIQRFQQESGLGRRARQVIFRSGTPLQPEALERVACLRAATIIIPADTRDPDSLVTADMETIKALLSIGAEAWRRGSEPPPAVAELFNPRNLPVAARAYPGPLEVISSHATVSRLLVQNVLHPGLSTFYNEVFASPDGNEFFLQDAGAFEADTLAEAARRTPRAILCGLLRRESAEWRPWLNAPPETRIEPGDQLVFLARDFEASQPGEPVPSPDPHPAPPPDPAEPLPLSPEVPPEPEPRRLLVLGWNRRMPVMLAELATYDPFAFTVTIVSTTPAAHREAALQSAEVEASSLTIEHVEADFMLENVLRRLDPARYGSVLLLSSDRIHSREEADARALVGSLVLEEILQDPASRPQVIVELIDPDNASLVGHDRNETLISPLVMSHMLAQVALRRELKTIFEELFTAGGAEILFRDPPEALAAGNPDFQALAAWFAARGETALGIYRRQPGTGEARLELNPTPPLALKPDDRLVTLGMLSARPHKGGEPGKRS